MHIKQHLNELNAIDMLFKSMTNESNKKPIWLLSQNNMNITQLLNDIRRCGYLGHVRDGNWHEEKGIQHVKNDFVTKKG